MIAIDTNSPLPIYDQIKTGIKGLIAQGRLRAGDGAPSVRGMAVRLKVNPNTVARAFRELAVEGIFESRRGSGNVVAAGAAEKTKPAKGAARKALRDAVERARREGLSWRDIAGVVAQRRGEDR